MDEQIGPYRIGARLGAGGMGVVHEAFHLALQQRVALKLLPRQGLDARQVERFFSEARVAARVRHPNIVGVRDVGVEGAQLYLAMDLVEGESLQERIHREGPLDPIEAARLVLDLCRGVQAAHEADVLHRDLKPANVLLPRGSRTPMLADFGVAKDLARPESLTSTGEVLGTPSHMSPEQADGQRASVRSDVYGLGAILYHALTGRPPQSGGSLMDLLTAVILRPVTPPRELVEEVPEYLEAICLRCLDKSPGARFASAADLAEELERFLAGHWRPSRRLLPRPSRMRRVASAALIAAAAGVGIWLADRRRIEPAARASAPAPAAPASSPGLAPRLPVQLAAAGRQLADLPELELEEPWLATIDAGGVRLDARGRTRPGLVLPLALFAPRLEVEVDLAIERLEPAAQLELRLASLDGRTTVGVDVRPSSPTPFARSAPSVRLRAADDAAPAADLPPVGVRLVLDGRQVRLFSAGGALLAATELPRPAQLGDYTLALRLNRQARSDALGLARARLARLCLRAPRDGLKLRSARGLPHEVGRLGRQVAAGQADALPRLLALARHADPRVRRPAAYLHAIAADPGPDPLPRAQRLSLQWELDEGTPWFERRWRADLFHLSPSVRQALAQALLIRLRAVRNNPQPTHPEALVRRALALVRANRDPARAALLFLAAGAAAEPHRLERGLTWARVGDVTHALELLAPLERATPGITKGEAGLAAYRAGDRRQALALWEHDAGPYAETLLPGARGTN